MTVKNSMLYQLKGQKFQYKSEIVPYTYDASRWGRAPRASEDARDNWRGEFLSVCRPERTFFESTLYSLLLNMGFFSERFLRIQRFLMFR
nr:unnamed protein product [Haemonchus contortus]